MITFIQDPTQEDQAFIDLAYKQKGAFFAPKLVHTGAFTIEQYLHFGKPGFNFTDIELFYEKLDLPAIETKMFDLDLERQLLVHYLSNLLTEADHTILNLPIIDFSEQFIAEFKFIVSHFDHREITIITEAKQIVSSLSTLNEHPTMMLPTYQFKVSRREIVGSFLGGKLLVLTSLVFALMILLFAITIDNKLSGEFLDYLDIPNDYIIINNEPTACDFNQSYYTIASSDCANSDPITYQQLTELQSLDNVEFFGFDDKYNLATVELAIQDGQKVTASIPELEFSTKGLFSSIPCVNPDTTPTMITCEEYNPENSVISRVTADYSDALTRNVSLGTDVSPSFIFIKSNDVDTLSNAIANRFPDINIYTNKSTESYVRTSNKKLIRDALLSSTIISIISVIVLNLLISHFKLYLRGHKYLLSYQTRMPKLINRFYFGAQLIYYGAIIIIGNMIALRLMHSTIGLLIGLYLGVLNACLWIICSDLNGRQYRDEDHKLMGTIKTNNKLKKHSK